MISVKRKIGFGGGRRAQRAARERERCTPRPGRIPRVTRLMALAIHFHELLREGRVQDQSELARLVHVTQPRMTQIMNLLHLAPDIQEEILSLPPVEPDSETVTERDLRPVAALTDWREQRRAWRRLKGDTGGTRAVVCRRQRGHSRFAVAQPDAMEVMV